MSALGEKESRSETEARSSGRVALDPTCGGSRYYPLHELASGGMATVELALQVGPGGFERLVALKRTKPQLAHSEELAAMFAEEARIAASLHHPNLVHAYEAGRDWSGLFLALEYLSGQTYGSLLERVERRELRFRLALEILMATLEGLECVHQLRGISGLPLGLVHRDISPSNLFITYSGRVKVLDFGIAKSRLSAIETRAGVLKGKVSYMAPEHLLGAQIDARADLYAVGVMLWEAIAGRRRWGRTAEPEVIRRQLLAEAPDSPGAAARGIPALAEEICTKALAFEPRRRFQSAAEFRAALEPLAELVGPRPLPRELGAYVAAHFELERARQERDIERELAALDRSGPHTRSGFTPPPVREAPPRPEQAPDAETELATRRLDLPLPAGAPEVTRYRQGILFATLGFGAALMLVHGERAHADAVPGVQAALAQPNARGVASARPVPTATIAAPAAPSNAAPPASASAAAPAAASTAAARRAAPRRGLTLDRGSPW